MPGCSRKIYTCGRVSSSINKIAVGFRTNWYNDWLSATVLITLTLESRLEIHDASEEKWKPMRRKNRNASARVEGYMLPSPSRNLGPPENALAAYSLCQCTSRHSPSTSSKIIREIDCQWAHSVRSSSLPIEHPKPPFDHKSLLSWPSVTSCRFPLANITLHNLLLIATILHDLVSIVTGWHQPPNPPWNPNKLLTDRKKCILK